MPPMCRAGHQHSFLEEERHDLGEAYFRQEYCCSFEAMEGLVFPDFARCVVPTFPDQSAKDAMAPHAAPADDPGLLVRYGAPSAINP